MTTNCTIWSKWSDQLQFGHGFRAVDDLFGVPPRHPPQPTSIRPRVQGLGLLLAALPNLVAGLALQFGHGFRAVDDGLLDFSAPALEVTSIRPRLQGRG